MDIPIATTDFPNMEAGLKAAEAAVAAGDLATARAIWGALRERYPTEATGYLRPVAMLTQRGMLAEADALLSEGHEKFPDHAAMAMDWGWMGLRMNDLPAALRRWENIRARFPEHAAGFLGYAMCLREMRRLEEAEALVTRAIELHPNDVGLASEFGWLAHMQRNWPEAIRRWEDMRARFPEHSSGYSRGTISLREAGRIDEFEQLALESIERFPRESWAEIEYASAADARQDWPEALRRWQRARDRFPSDLNGYLRGANTLQQLGRVDEAEAILLAAIERIPDQIGLAAEYAWMAHRRRDWPEAVRRWEQVRRSFPDHPMGFIHGVIALRDAQDRDAAEALAQDAVQRFPDEVSVLIEYARTAFVRREWPEAERRWARILNRFPDHSTAYMTQAAVLRETRRFDEADALLEAGLRRFPNEPGILVELAWVAQRREDWPVASERWARVREHIPNMLHSYIEASTALCECRRLDDAEAVLQQAMSRFPNEPAGFTAYANVATKRNDWAEALRRWTNVCERFSFDPAYTQHVHIARIRLAEVHPEGADIDPAPDQHSGRFGSEANPDRGRMRDIMLAFESLGGMGGGCEFGSAQRMFGAEPLGLLRWTNMSPQQLIVAFDARFEGVGNPEQTELEVQRGEYWTSDNRFGMTMHTFIQESEISSDKMFTQACRRLRYLKRKLLDDLDSASKIFVYKVTGSVLTDDELLGIHTSIRKYGDTTLLYVRPCDATHQANDVEVIRPGLLVGHIDQFAAMVEPGGRLTDTTEEAIWQSWAEICRRAHALWLESKEQGASFRQQARPPESAQAPDITATEAPTVVAASAPNGGPEPASVLTSVARRIREAARRITH